MGENASNYANAEFDRLFAQMKDLDNGPQRQTLIDHMNHIVQHDAPWIFCFYPKSYTLAHSWLHNRKPTDVGHNGLKYQRIDVAERERRRAEWNEPVLWPLALVVVALAALAVPALLGYRRRERATARN